MILTDEAIKLSGFHPEHLRELLREKRIDGEKIGRTWLVDEASLRAYLKEQSEKGERRGRPKHKN